MGKLETLDVVFDNASGIFFAGNIVSGKVLFIINEPVKLRSIRLRFYGQASTSFSIYVQRHHSGSGSGPRGTTVWYRGSESYLEIETTLWGKKANDKGEDPTMPAGSYQYPFSFSLPPQCPSSFEGTYGSIRYICKVTVDIPWKFDYTAKRPINVVSLVDLNYMPNAVTPLSIQQTKALGCWCCKRGNIECQVKIPKGAFVPGEGIPIKMEVTNGSSNKVDYVEVSLVEHVFYSGQRSSVDFYAPGNSFKENQRTVAMLKKGEISSGQAQSWNDDLLVVPAVAPSLLTCQIIKITYLLHFKISPSGCCHSNFEFNLPVTIGNVPYRATFQQFNQNFQNRQPQNSIVLPIGGNMYPDLPPPLYKDTVFGQSDIKEEGDNEYTKGQLTYTPKYPVYDWSTG